MPKIFKDSPDAMSGLALGRNQSRLAGNEENHITVGELGTTISGPMSFGASTEQLRFNGLFVMNRALDLAIPSTLAFPSPVLRVDPPVGQFKSVMEQVAIIAGLIGMLPK